MVELLGDHHPDTLVDRANLASSYQSAVRTSPAVALLAEAIEGTHPIDVGHPNLDSSDHGT